MKIAVIGTGNIGSTLGKAWAAAGHDVLYGSRNPEHQTGNLALKPVATVKDAIQHGEVVLLAIPGRALGSTVDSIDLKGKIIIDATNFGDISSNEIATTNVYKAFNTLGYEVFQNAKFGDFIADMMYVGPEDNRQLIETLIKDVGVNPVYIGDLDQIGLLDSALSLWFALSRQFGRHLAFKILSD